MDELNKELQELIKLDPTSMDDAQKSRLAELPMLIVQAGNSALETKSKDLESALAQKDHFRTKAEKAEADKKILEAKLSTSQKTALDVGDYINISSSLDGLDQREKEYLAQQHTLTGKPLNEIRNSEDFSFWQSAYRQKVEKDKLTLKPTNRQSESEEPISLEQALTEARTTQEKEEILSQMGYDFKSKSRSDKVILGTSRSY
jgi:hypothetical protein